jgi:hypothetical protein
LHSDAPSGAFLPWQFAVRGEIAELEVDGSVIVNEPELLVRLRVRTYSMRPRRVGQQGRSTRALQAYLGHKTIQDTVRYTELTPTRFNNFWRE